jgi:putative restriction endonuclease
VIKSGTSEDYPGSMDLSRDLAFRESAFAWLRAEMLTREVFSRADLAGFMWEGRPVRLVGTQTGIWRVKGVSDAAISIMTAYVPKGERRPYEDSYGLDDLLRYKWRGTDPMLADNVWLRRAMELRLPLIWFIGVDYAPGTKTQVFLPQFPVYLVDEEPEHHQFVVAVDGQQTLPRSASAEVIDITRRYNTSIAKVRVHQPVFRQAVLIAYERRCAVCRLPFPELLDAAHIKSDAEGGAATVTNGLSLCKIHHGAYDRDIIGISPDYRIHVRESVLQTFDGPTLQHSIKEMHGERLRQLPSATRQRPDRDLLAERFERFSRAS